jgi:hypothetical protein
VKSGCSQLLVFKLGSRKNRLFGSAKAVFADFTRVPVGVETSLVSICIFLISRVLINKKNTKRRKSIG